MNETFVILYVSKTGTTHASMGVWCPLIKSNNTCYTLSIFISYTILIYYYYFQIIVSLKFNLIIIYQILLLLLLLFVVSLIYTV